MGSIDINTIQQFLKINGEQLSIPEIMGIIRRIDISGDMTITEEEWLQFFTPSWQDSSVIGADYRGQRSSLYSPQLITTTPPQHVNGRGSSGLGIRRDVRPNVKTFHRRGDSYNNQDSADRSPLSLNGSYVHQNSNK